MPRKDRRKIICRANNTIDETATKGDHFSWKTQGPAEHMGTVGICSPLHCVFKWILRQHLKPPPPNATRGHLYIT
jgi:hypothetical protein